MVKRIKLKKPLKGKKVKKLNKKLDKKSEKKELQKDETIPKRISKKQEQMQISEPEVPKSDTTPQEPIKTDVTPQEPIKTEPLSIDVMPQESILSPVGGEINTETNANRNGKFLSKLGSGKEGDNTGMTIFIIIIILIIIVIAGYFGYTFLFKQGFITGDRPGLPQFYIHKPTDSHHVDFQMAHGLGTPFFPKSADPNKYKLNTQDEYEDAILKSKVSEKEMQAQKFRSIQVPVNGALRGKLCNGEMWKTDNQIPLTNRVSLNKTTGVLNKAYATTCGKYADQKVVQTGGIDQQSSYVKNGFNSLKNAEFTRDNRIKNLTTSNETGISRINDIDNRVKDIIGVSNTEFQTYMPQAEILMQK